MRRVPGLRRPKSLRPKTALHCNELSYLLRGLVAERHPFGPDDSVAHVGGPALIPAVAKDEVLDHAAFEPLAAGIVLDVSRVEIIGRDGVVLYANGESFGYFTGLVAYLLQLQRRIRKTEAPRNAISMIGCGLPSSARRPSLRMARARSR